jgi:hypothetical protein
MARETHGRASLLVALLLLFAACEKESIVEGFPEGERVPILFSMDMGGYGAGGEVVRRAGVSEAATTAIMLNDSMYLEATLREDPADELRDAAAFSNGQRICFAVFNASTQAQLDSKFYTYSMGTGKFTPVSTPLGVVPDGSTVYRFVAYSYFGTTNTNPATTITPDVDLVWGKAATDRTVVDTETSRTVTIKMEHLFAQVSVKVRSSISGATIEAMSGVVVNGGKQVTLTPFDGSLTPTGSVAAQGLTFPNSYPTTEIVSSYRRISPVTVAPATVTIGSVTVKRNNTTYAPYTARVAEFDRTLDVAKSYTLVVDLKGVGRWARSNVVWRKVSISTDPKYPGYLTFATTPEENVGTGAIPANVQGVFFRWGALVALAPKQYLTGQYDGVSYKSIIYSASGNYNLPSTFTQTPVGDESEEDDAFATYNNNTGFDASVNKGDICRYITAQGWVSRGSWRLPTAAEWEALKAMPNVAPTTTQPWHTVEESNLDAAPYDENTAFGFYQPAARIHGPDGSPDNVTNPRLLNVCLTGGGVIRVQSTYGVPVNFNHTGSCWSSSSSRGATWSYYNGFQVYTTSSSVSTAGANNVRCIRSDI